VVSDGDVVVVMCGPFPVEEGGSAVGGWSGWSEWW